MAAGPPCDAAPARDRGAVRRGRIGGDRAVARGAAGLCGADRAADAARARRVRGRGRPRDGEQAQPGQGADAPGLQRGARGVERDRVLDRDAPGGARVGGDLRRGGARGARVFRADRGAVRVGAEQGRLGARGRVVGQEPRGPDASALHHTTARGHGTPGGDQPVAGGGPPPPLGGPRRVHPQVAGHQHRHALSRCADAPGQRCGLLRARGGGGGAAALDQARAHVRV